LSELNDRLRLQKDENELLQLLLDQTQTQVALNAASQDELIEDLKQASANTMVIEGSLEKIMEEKFQLEQELAEKITELMESSMANDDLRRQLDGKQESEIGQQDSFAPPTGQPVTTAVSQPVMPTIDPALLPTTCQPNLPVSATEPATNQVLTMSSGKQIYVYHEFPALARRSPTDRIKSFSWSFVKTCTLLAAAVLLTLVGSVFATSLNNGISYGEALDLILTNVFTMLGIN
ncbi:MAG: hypothetical protein LBU61_01585, partial [Coriobacteriales bacterium]|nr:hypothetical protein [Coriobacteriales bacterium]